MKVVICGAGVIGASLAYFLVQRGVDVTIIDRCGVAVAASGKSGGFLALDWCDGSPMQQLARNSFELHAELATSFDQAYDYRRLDTYLVEGTEHNSLVPSRQGNPKWLNGNCAVRYALGTSTTTAQVHPEKFTRALVDAAIARGATLQIGCIEGISLSGTPSTVRSIVVDGTPTSADAAVIAMGPWSNTASKWLPLPPVGGAKSQSITLHPIDGIPAHALFVDYRTEAGEQHAPEIFARPDGEVYICGMSDDTPVPESADQVAPNLPACDALHKMAANLSSSLANAKRTRNQACYRPICIDGLPLLGQIPGVNGAFVATGHNCWGILNAPASGLAMTELIVDGHAKTIDLSPFEPMRLMHHMPVVGS
ncbi:MAG: NAD(P)/FAD-dependent oxidoreductase [Acidiferrobacterales bacterium]